MITVTQPTCPAAAAIMSADEPVCSTPPNRSQKHRIFGLWEKHAVKLDFEYKTPPW